MDHLQQKILVPLLFSLFAVSVLPSLATAAEDGTWQFQLAPYAWLSGLEGSVATLPGLPPADIDVDFYDDILGNINGAFMLVGEARKGRFGITMDLVYTDIESDSAIPGKNFTTLTSQTTNWIVSAAGFYRMMANDKAFIDGLVGVRYWSADSELTLSGGPAGSYAIDNGEEWFDPIIGLKGLTTLGDSKLFLSGFFIIGGFGAGSDFLWDVNANLGYQWGEIFSTTIGYRYLDVDYEDDGFLYDVAQHGPTLGLSWRF